MAETSPRRAPTKLLDQSPSSRPDREYLDECLAALIDKVDLRVQRSHGSYSEDRVYVRRAARQVIRLTDELKLGHLVGPVAPTRAKPQFLLFFQPEHGERVVLKVYGKSRPGEAFAQSLWRRHDLRFVDVLNSGDHPVSWLVLRAVNTTDVAHGPLVGS